MGKGQRDNYRLVTLVVEDEVVGGAVVGSQTLLDRLHVRLVADNVGVLDHGTPQGTRLPPVVRLWDVADLLWGQAGGVRLVI